MSAKPSWLRDDDETAYGIEDSQAQKLWVRLLPLTAGEIAEADVTTEERFEIAGVDAK